ncbi:RtcB family protein [Candidatus Woesearchaeota archaeon]|nr:RtcB family protein [Candidatus Woesearchaeota archaeon]MBW3022406.1 RtcB family protein [Candidatus Woesearchaeota archaeon]
MQPKKLTDFMYEIPKEKGMNVPCRIFASEKLLKLMQQDRTLIQGKEVAFLPGIYKYSIIMPDGHQGYGFPIGGVAALDTKTGGISPGGIGYDINCGVRLLRTNIKYEEAKEKVKELLDKLFQYCPAGLGSSNIRVNDEELDNILNKGAEWAVENDYGDNDDILHCEESGRMKQADAKAVSPQAKKRGKKQIATLGSGNHFLEIQYVEEIYDEKTAKAFGLEKGNVVFMIHCGSRGLGHQVCSDYLRDMERTFPDIVKKLPDRELVYAPAGHPLCERYLKAMAAAANFAWCNRHVLGHQTRKAILEFFPDAEVKTVYDVAHNIAKVEKHKIDGKDVEVYLHRKGATRAFGPSRPEVPKAYKSVGQPILLPGSMGTASYILVGTDEGVELTFGSTAHGAGRVMSRHAALKEFRGEQIVKDLAAKGITVKGASMKGIAEEASAAYKDVDEVVKVSDAANIGRKVARLKPLGVVKG